METSRILIIIILCIGAIQGLVFGLVLLRSNKTNKLANRILASILFLLSYRLLVQVMRLFGLGYYDGWYYIMLDYSWVTGALIYFYTKAQIAPSFSISKKEWKHFIPVILQVSFSLFVRIQNLYWDGTRESLSWLGYWGYVIWMNNPTIYIIASGLIIYYAILSEKAISKSETIFNLKPDSLSWMRRILSSFKYYFTVVLVILIADLIIFSTVTDNSYFYFVRFYYYPFFIGLSVLTYWTGIAGFIRRNEEGLVIRRKMTEDEEVRLREIAVSLERLMEERKVYKNQDISINHLAEELEVKPYLVSKSLNEILNKKFNDFINDYRVDEVKRLVNDSANDQFTLLSLAMDAGFNSKSSFHRAVKKRLGISPSELKDQ